jgi:hypothetical protein
MELAELVSAITEFQNWNHPEKIRFFGWFLQSKRAKERFSPADILGCYRQLSLTEPSSIHPFLKSLEGQKPKQILKDAKGYYLEFSLRKAMEEKYGQRTITIQVTQMLADLPSRVPDVSEREFLDEALICYKHKAFRATIVMTWNLAYDHLLSYILKHKLADFNAQWPKSFTKRHAQARVSTVGVREDFGELKESEVIAISKSAAIISADVFKVMDEKLDKRNSAAHPSVLHIGQIQAESVIDDLVNNVVLKFHV